jgi:hypothetical protein
MCGFFKVLFKLKNHDLYHAADIFAAFYTFVSGNDIDPSPPRQLARLLTGISRGGQDDKMNPKSKVQNLKTSPRIIRR